ncbi:hypothetical protein ACHAWF_013244 [Thalassiosira exigua]
MAAPAASSASAFAAPSSPPSQSRPTPSACLSAEVARCAASPDRAAGRRSCAASLRRWTREVLPGLSRGEALASLEARPPSDNDEHGGGDDGGGSGDGNGGSALAALLDLVECRDGFSTEGHREAAVEVLKALVGLAFRAEGSESSVEGKGDDPKVRWILAHAYRRCAAAFRFRTARTEGGGGGGGRDGPLSRGTAAGPAEPSEHVRLSLVELTTDLAGRCRRHCHPPSAEYEKSEGEADVGARDKTDDTTLEASSDVCRALATSVLLDPCPEVQRAACSLIEILARTCPLAVRMSASSLLGPLTGRIVDGGPVDPSWGGTLAKKCLFGHRHAKTRKAAVQAAAAVASCCPRSGPFVRNREGGSDVFGEVPESAFPNNTENGMDVSKRGCGSASMERMLHEALLPGYDDLLASDPSASVQIAVLDALGDATGVLHWDYAPAETAPNVHSNLASTMDLASVVESRILSLILSGASVGNSEKVRSLASRILRTIRSRNDDSAAGKGEMRPQWMEVLAAYFLPTLELMLVACARDGWTCHKGVRSLEALQVLLALSLLRVEDDPLSSASGLWNDAFLVVRSAVDVLSESVLSDEREVLEAALSCCRMLGRSGRYAKAVVDIISAEIGGGADESSVLKVDLAEGPSMASSPRRLTSLLLILDGIMRGSLDDRELISILHDIKPGLSAPSAGWFRSSPVLATTIASILCHNIVTNNVPTDVSLAWALLEACESFVLLMARRGDREAGEDTVQIPDGTVVDLLVGMTYLLGCPEEHSLSSRAAEVLEAFSATRRDASKESAYEEGVSLLDVYFREVMRRIASSATPFPWRQSDPAFLAVNALLRACRGSTVGRNFDAAAPFFIGHLSADSHCGGDDERDRREQAVSKDEMMEAYSLRISLMALLQTVLSDGSFFSQTEGLTPALTTFSAQFAADVLLSLVLPNLVWKAGGLASALRKLSAATLFSLLSHQSNHREQRHQGCNEATSGFLHPEAVSNLIPLLHSNLDDTESTTRELSCACLSLVLEHVSVETFCSIWEANTRVIDTLYPRLLELLDDSHDPVRIAACNALEGFLYLECSVASNSSFRLGLSSLENITSSLLIQLDDPDVEIQERVFRVLSSLLELQYQKNKCTHLERGKGVVEMMKRLFEESLSSHRDGSYCHSLLEKIHCIDVSAADT